MALSLRPSLERALGVVSVALGAPLVARPGAVADTIGVGDSPRHRATLLAVGLRELTAAAGLLARPSRVWTWARVAGDAVDLSLLAAAWRRPGSRLTSLVSSQLPGTVASLLGRPNQRQRGRISAAMAAVAGITAVDVYAAIRPKRDRPRKDSAVDLTSATTVVGSPEEVYAFWRDLEHLPEFMAHLDSVQETGERTSRWSASAPFGRTVDWQAEITQDEPGRVLGWRSLDGADVRNEGSVRFAAAPGGRGTEVRVHISYDIPGGPLGQAFARFFGEDPRQQVDDDMRRFKQVFETGEVVRSDGAPGGKRARKEFPQRPAQPLTDTEYAEFVTTGDAR